MTKKQEELLELLMEMKMLVEDIHKTMNLVNTEEKTQLLINYIHHYKGLLTPHAVVQGAERISKY